MSIPSFVATEAFAAGQTITLGEDEAHHMRVRRLEPGSRVGLLDGQGTRGEGVLVRLAKRHATVAVETAESEAQPPSVHLIIPVADKDRMLWLAEKAAELGATSWRPVVYRRSKSVTGRGEGTMFTQKVVARMASALEQSGGAWLPTMYPDARIDRAIAATPAGARLMLDASGPPLLAALDTVEAPVTIAVGPEGGLEGDEAQALSDAGFRPVSLGKGILRFETAALAALAIVRAKLTTED